MKIIYYLISTFFLLTSHSLFAKGGNLNISPLYGFERVQKLSPEVKTKNRTFVGVRVVYGPPLFSFESEVTRSNDTETLPARGITEEEESYAAKLGFRSSFNLVLLRWYIRAGGHARKSTYDRTENGVNTTREPAIYVSPYAGTGFTFNLAANLFASGGITAIFTGKPKGSDRDYQTTLAFGMRL